MWEFYTSSICNNLPGRNGMTGIILFYIKRVSCMDCLYEGAILFFPVITRYTMIYIIHTVEKATVNMNRITMQCRRCCLSCL
jgi:hypothetical protein